MCIMVHEQNNAHAPILEPCGVKLFVHIYCLCYMCACIYSSYNYIALLSFRNTIYTYLQTRCAVLGRLWVAVYMHQLMWLNRVKHNNTTADPHFLAIRICNCQMDFDTSRICVNIFSCNVFDVYRHNVRSCPQLVFQYVCTSRCWVIFDHSQNGTQTILF